MTAEDIGGHVVLWRFIGVAVSALIVSCGLARADITLRRIPVDGRAPIILIKGEFTPSDNPAVLSQEVAASGAKLVTFDSNGGNVVAAIAYGRMIRSLGLSTFQLRAAQCASACTLAFVGGVIRQAEPGAIGVHQSSFSPDAGLDGQSAVAAVQSMTAEIMTYLIEMGVDPKLLQLSLSVPSDDMRYLTASEMQIYKVTAGDLKDVPDTLTGATAPVAATPSPAVPAQAAPQTSGPVLSTEERAQTFVAAYHDAWSHGNTEALAFMEKAYGDTVEFYGKPTPKAVVLSEKRDFAARWPIRAYSIEPKSTHVVCSDACKVDGVVDWYAKRDQGDRVSSGSAGFSLIWDPNSGTIVSETGKVIDTDKGAAQPTRLISQWQSLNGECRGGSGDSAETQHSCTLREALGSKLESVGWCYGRPGEYGYQMDWHACRAAAPNAVSYIGAPATQPKASDFPADGRFAGKLALPDFKGRDRAFKSFRTRILDGMRQGPNFAGHFTIIQIGCGTGCSFAYVGDNNTGKVADFPRGGESNMYLNLEFALSSRLVAAQWFNYDAGRCYLEFFDYAGGAWKALTKNDIGTEDTCFKEIGENLR